MGKPEAKAGKASSRQTKNGPGAKTTSQPVRRGLRAVIGVWKQIAIWKEKATEEEEAKGNRQAKGRQKVKKKPEPETWKALAEKLERRTGIPISTDPKTGKKSRKETEDRAWQYVKAIMETRSAESRPDTRSTKVLEAKAGDIRTPAALLEFCTEMQEFIRSVEEILSATHEGRGALKSGEPICVAEVNRAWEHLRFVAGQSQRPYPEQPRRKPRSGVQAIDQIAQVMAWCYGNRGAVDPVTAAAGGSPEGESAPPKIETPKPEERNGDKIPKGFTSRFGGAVLHTENFAVVRAHGKQFICQRDDQRAVVRALIDSVEELIGIGEEGTIPCVDTASLRVRAGLSDTARVDKMVKRVDPKGELFKRERGFFSLCLPATARPQNDHTTATRRPQNQGG